MLRNWFQLSRPRTWHVSTDHKVQFYPVLFVLIILEQNSPYVSLVMYEISSWIWPTVEPYSSSFISSYLILSYLTTSRSFSSTNYPSDITHTHRPSSLTHTLSLHTNFQINPPSLTTYTYTHTYTHLQLQLHTRLPLYSVGSSHVHLFMSQELRMGCARGAVDAFGMFFPDIGTVKEHSWDILFYISVESLD